jgi:prolyl-tRNA synthetase
MSSNEVLDFLKNNKIEVEVIEFSTTVKTVEEASKASKFPPEKIIKSILIIAGEEPYLVLVQGNKRLNLSEISKILGDKVRLATPQEIEKFTNFKPGEITPFSERIVGNIKILMDENLLKIDEVIIGGGSLYSLIKIKIIDLIKILNPIIIRIP